MFLLFYRFLKGEDISGQLAYLRRHGVTVARIFSYWKTDLAPGYERPEQTFPDYFDQLRAFIRLLNDNGQRVEVVGHTDSTRDRQWSERLIDVCAEFTANTGAFFEVGNEPSVRKPEPLDTRSLTPADRKGVLCSAGDYAPDDSKDPATLHTLDFGTAHCPRTQCGGDWVRRGKELHEFKTGGITDPRYPGANIPWSNDEPEGFAEQDRNGAGQRCTQLADFEEHFALCSIMGVGATMHSTLGLEGRDPTTGPTHDAISTAIGNIWRFVGPEWNSGVYTRGGLAESPLDDHGIPATSRVYVKMLGNRAMAVACQAGDGWRAEDHLQNGWRIVETRGERHTIVLLER